MINRHDRANDFVLAQAASTAKGGRFEAALVLPAKLPWRRLVIRAYAANETAEALTCRLREVKTPAPEGPAEPSARHRSDN